MKIIYDDVKNGNVENNERIYKFEEFGGIEDIKKFTDDLENSFSDIKEVKCLDIEGNMIESYDQKEKFLENLTLENAKNIAEYQFSCPYTQKIVDFNVMDSTITYMDDLGLIQENDRKNNEPEYYIFDSRKVVKRVPAYEHYYTMNSNNEWELDSSMIRRFYDTAYDFDKVSEEEAMSFLKGRIK